MYPYPRILSVVFSSADSAVRDAGNCTATLIYRINCDIPLPAPLAPHPTPPPTARPSTASFLRGTFVEHGLQLCSQGPFFSKKMDDLVPFRIFCRYRKTPIISPGLIFVQRVLLWILFPGGLFSEGLSIGRDFAFQNGLELTTKTT